MVVAPLETNNEWKKFPVGERWIKGIWRVEEDNQSSIGSYITRLVSILESGDKCEWVHYGSSVDGGRKAYMLSLWSISWGDSPLPYLWQRSLCLGTCCKKVEILSNGKEENHLHKSPI